jgi:hypothetical protein
MIGISSKRAVAVVSGVASVAIVVLVVALIASTAGATPKCRYAFGGLWIVTTPDHPHAWFKYVETPLDIVGKRSAVNSWLQSGDPPQGFDPELTEWIGGGQLMATGKYTFRASAAMWGINSTTHAKYIILSESEGRWIDENHREQTTWLALYFKSQDADGDGLPDPGQKPFHVGSGRKYYMTREPWFDLKPSE